MTPKNKKKDSLSEEEEKCAIAFDVSMEEAFAVCKGSAGKERFFCEMGSLLGLSTDDATDLSARCKTMLSLFENKNEREDICHDFRNIRAVVMCIAWKKMESEQIPFKDAMNAAWAEVKDKCGEVEAYI